MNHPRTIKTSFNFNDIYDVYFQLRLKLIDFKGNESNHSKFE